MLGDDEAMEERLRSWLFDDKKTLDYKSLSESFKMHVNVAKQHLFSLASKWSSEIVVRYSLSGCDPSGILRVRLVFEEDLEAAKASLEPSSSLCVHSIAIKGHYQLTPGIGAQESLPPTRSSAIRNKSALAKNNVLEKQQEAHKGEKTLKSEIKIEPKAEQLPLKESSAGEKNVSKSLTEIKSKLGSSKKGLVGMWEKAAEKKAAEKENRINAKKEEEVVKSEAKKSKKPKAKPSSSSTSNKKRKRIQVFSDSESEQEDVEDEEKEDALRTQESGVEDVPMVESEEEESEEEIPATPTIQEPAPIKKRRVRKEVRKQYVGEDGYMVTKKEFELQSEDEEDAVVKDDKSDGVKPVISKPSPKKTKQSMNKNNKQSSIMNFFMKK